VKNLLSSGNYKTPGKRLFKRVKASRDICELRNMINVGYLITRWALERKECRGLHFTTDYPLHAYDKPTE
jgi:L-aspartate oxidase